MSVEAKETTQTYDLRQSEMKCSEMMVTYVNDNLSRPAEKLCLSF